MTLPTVMSPGARKRIRREFADRARHLAKTRGQLGSVIRDGGPRLVFVYKSGPLIIRCTLSDEHLTVNHYSRLTGRLQVAMTCGRPYRFGRQMARMETLLVLMEIMKAEMVLDDLAGV